MTVTKGLKFTSESFHMKAEVSAVRETEIDVILTPSDGNAWEEKGWDLRYVISCFKKGHYKPIQQNLENISVW